jgi:PAS domain S-box-containing protein
MKSLLNKHPIIREILDSLNDAVFIHEFSTGEIHEVNQQACNMYGYTQDEMKHLKIVDMSSGVSPYTQNDALKFIQKSVEGQPQLFEWHARHRNGNLFWVEINMKYSTLGGTMLVIVIARDITDRKKNETDLRESEERYRMLFDNNPNPMWVYDIETLKFLTVNDAAVYHYGYSKDEFLVMTLKDIRPPEDIPILLQVIGEAKNLLRETGTWNHRKKDGTIINVEITTHELAYKNSNSRLVLINDVTERKKIQDDLRASEERFRLTFKTSPDSVNINRLSDGMYVEINEGFSRIMGYTNDDVIGKTSLGLNIWSNPEDRKELVRGLREKGYYDNLEAQFRKKDGIILTGLMSARLINLKGEPHLISITRDISDRKIAEVKIMDALKKAEQADNLKTQFLYNMSHEIRTPMNAICGFSDLLCNPNLPYEKQQKYSGIIQRRTNDLLTLIEDILDISKIEVDQLQLKETSGDVNELLKDLYQTWANFRIAGEIPKNISWKIEYSLIPPENYVTTDFFRLRQILSNLLANAYKYTEEGIITFGCFLNQNKELQFYVKDTGIGIPNDKYDIIFDRFRQLEEGYLNRKSSGTGLGLSIVKGLVNLMNGKIWLESEPGKGSIFQFTLPYFPEINIQIKTTKEMPENKDWSDKSILIVEDDISNSELIKALLEDYNFNLLFAETGKECLEILFGQKLHIDFILMDIRLPDISGLDLTRKIKKDNPKMPIIAQTAYATSHDLAECLNAGCNNYIPKPLIREKLIEKIMVYINI